MTPDYGLADDAFGTAFVIQVCGVEPAVAAVQITVDHAEDAFHIHAGIVFRKAHHAETELLFHAEQPAFRTDKDSN